MAEHKWADVLRAIAEKGFEAVERPNKYCPGAWVSPSIYCNPLTNPELEWRIKPEPKPDVVRYVNVYGVTGIGELCESNSVVLANRRYTSSPASGALRLTFIDNNGAYKLKSAEVLP